MRLRFGALRRLIQESFYDKYFLEELPIVLRDAAPELFRQMSSKPIGYGNERVVFGFGGDAVIKFMPTYDYTQENVDRLLSGVRSSYDLEVIDSGVIESSIDDAPVTFALWYVQPRYEPLPHDIESVIDDVVSDRMKIEDVDDPRIQDFLRRYIGLPYDLAGNNVMIDSSGEYRISDI